MKARKSVNIQGVKTTSTRTFNNEIEAVNQLIEWKNEYEAKGWVTKEQVGNEILMVRIEGNKRNFCKLYI